MRKNECAKMSVCCARIDATRLATKLLDVMTECAKMNAQNACARMNAQRWRPNYLAAALGYERGFIGASTLVIDFIVVDLFVWKALNSLSLFPIPYPLVRNIYKRSYSRHTIE